jgi:hypothetical protein
MSDIPPEGTVERPFRENPPRLLREVNWGGLAVHFGAEDGPPVAPPPPTR